MTPDHVVGNAQHFTQLTHLHLVKIGQRFNDFSRGNHLFNNGHPVVMGLDGVGPFGGAAFNGVGVDGALSQQMIFDAQPASFTLKNLDECIANGPAFLLGFGHALQSFQEGVGGVDKVEILVQLQLFEHLNDGFGFIFAHEAVVHMQQVQTVGTESLAEQTGRHGGIDTAAGQQKDRTITHLIADFLHLVGHVTVHGPGGCALTDFKREVGDHLITVQGVVHLGMILETVATQFITADGCKMVRRGSFTQNGVTQLFKVGADLGHRVKMTHPDLLHLVQPCKKRMLPLDVQIGVSPFLFAVNHLAAVMLGDLLVPEAEPQNGHIQIVNLFGVGRVFPKRGEGGAPGKDDAFVPAKIFNGIFGLANFSQNPAAANLGGDEVGVLAAKIDNCDGIVLHETVPSEGEEAEGGCCRR